MARLFKKKKENLTLIAEDARDTGSIPGLGKSPEEGKGNPYWCFCLENSMDRGAWQAPFESMGTQSRTHLKTDTYTLQKIFMKRREG